MRFKSKVAVALAAAALLAGAFAGAVSAYAQTVPTQSVALDVTGWQMSPADRAGYVFAEGTYGQAITLQPTVMSAIELPGDKFTYQVLVLDSPDASGTRTWTWKTFRDFEDPQLETTNTIPPFTYALGQDDQVLLSDGSSVEPVFPYQIRVDYKPGGSDSLGAPSYSETETVGLIRNASTRVVIATSGTVRHSGTKFKFTVLPDSGIGTVRVTVTRKGAKALTYNLQTDDTGTVSATLKLGSANGTYEVTAKFLGNTFGATSKTASKSLKATH